MPLNLLAQDLESEPLVLGAGQRIAQFSVSPGRVGERGRLAGGEVGVGELRLERLKIGAELFDSRRQRLERTALVEAELALRAPRARPAGGRSGFSAASTGAASGPASP